MLLLFGTRAYGANEDRESSSELADFPIAAFVSTGISPDRQFIRSFIAGNAGLAFKGLYPGRRISEGPLLGGMFLSAGPIFGGMKPGRWFILGFITGVLNNGGRLPNTISVALATVLDGVLLVGVFLLQRDVPDKEGDVIDPKPKDLASVVKGAGSEEEVFPEDDFLVAEAFFQGGVVLVFEAFFQGGVVLVLEAFFQGGVLDRDAVTQSLVSIYTR